MNLVKNVRPLLTLFNIDTGQEAAVTTRPALPMWQPAGELAQQQPEPIIIPGYVPTSKPQEQPLSELLRIGRQYHPLCRNSFVECVQIGYYAYERREEWRTCALAAVYAGAFGPQSIERPDFSYSMAVWRLSQRVGFNVGQRQVIGPTGRHNNLADEMIKLVDENLWTRAGVADWLEALGF
jgi:hypothetical protein